MARIGSSELDVYPLCFGGNVLGWTADMASSHVAVALAWLLARPTVAAPIASASRVSQVADSLAAARVRLTSEDVAALDAASGD